MAALDRAPAPEELNARMVGIGMNFAANPNTDADIESILLHASTLGIDEEDLRRVQRNFL